MLKFSLVVATLGRFREVEELLSSLNGQVGLGVDFDLEVIVVDQNASDFGLQRLIYSKAYLFQVIYIRSEIKGLSVCRNIGLDKVSGTIVAFPDDDCRYYPDTLISVMPIIGCFDAVMGRIFDRQFGRNVIKSWPDKIKRVTFLNYYKLASSVTLFCVFDKTMRFDDRLGVGAEYGSCEDPDFIYRMLKKGSKLVYTPQVNIWHPMPDFSRISLGKVYSYAKGFGFFVVKGGGNKVYWFLAIVLNKFFQMILFRKRYRKGYFKAYFSGLLDGLLER